MHESVEHPRVALSTANGVRLTGSVSRLTAVARFGAVPVPCQVIGFANDVTRPPHLYAEVANAVPDCDYIEIDSRAHAGYLEQPAKSMQRSLVSPEELANKYEMKSGGDESL
jgi:pimeloyl-ACP methyl ester carboxylesterase